MNATDVIDSDGDLVAQTQALAPDGVEAMIDLYHDASSLTDLALLVRRNGWVVSPRA